MTKRQPKGTPVGGQFAEDRKPDGGDLSEPRSTAGKIAARLQKGTIVECVENTHIPSTAGTVIEITKTGAKTFEGKVVDPGGRENMAVGSAFALHIGTGADILGDEFSSNIVIAGKTVGRNTWRIRPTEDAGFEYEVSNDDSPDKKHDGRFFTCDECGEVCFEETCPRCGQPSRSLSGDTARELGLLDDEDDDGEQDQDTGFYRCGSCGAENHGVSNVCNNCMTTMDRVEYQSTVSTADKERYIAAIKAGYADLAAMMPSIDVSRYLPNDKGIELIANSSLTITGELETSNGIAWTGKLKVGDKTVFAENRGDGGSNHYSSEDGRGGWKLEEELSNRVKEGFPGLSEEAIDEFCSIIGMAHGGER